MNRTLFPVAVVLSTSSLMLVDSAIKGAAILLLAALVTLMLRRDSAATRHLAWLVAIAGMLVVPVFSAILPQWRALPAWAVISTEPVAVETPAPAVATPEQPQATVSPNASPVKSEVPTVLGNQPIAEVPVSQPAIVAVEVIPEPTEPRWNRVSALPLLWAIGFSVLVLRLMAARLMLWSNERRGKVIGLSQRPWDGRPEEKSNAPIVTAFQAACQQLGVRQPVRLLIYSERTIPVVWGIIRFRLLLPAAAGEWSAQQLNSVLLHELAHIKRRDTIAQLLAQIACALHWFNPLVWFAAWRLRVERERACDDLVLARGVQASAYAEHLLNVATRLSSSRWTQACGIAMARNSSLEGRLTAVLSKKRNRRSVTKVIVAVSLLLGSSIAIPIAMLRAVADTQDEDKKDLVQESKIPQAEMARDTTAAVLLKRWQALEERKTPLSEASLARLRVAIDKWVKQPPAKAKAAQVTALRDRNIGRAEHPVAEVAAWLDEIAAIHRGPLEFAINGETRVGEALSVERKASLKFGPAAENGLRAAWSRSPERDTYVVGDVVYTSLVIQNASEKTIEFTCPYSLDAIMSWEATAEDGRKIETQTTIYTGAIPLFTWRLKPGEVAEIGGRSAAIGEGERREQVNNAPTSTVLCAKRGEQVTVHWNVREPVAMTTGAVSFKVGVEDPPKGYGPRDWAGWFANQVRYRKQKDGTFPSVAFKNLRKWVIDDLSAKPNASGAAEAHAWLEATSADKNWAEDDFKSMIERIGKWKLSVIQRAMGYEEFASRCFPKQGRPATPDKLRGISFGQAAENGLRVAWAFDPAKKEYAVGETLKCRVIVHNSGSQPIQFLGSDIQDGDWSIRDAAGKPIKTKHLPYSNVFLHLKMLPYQRYRLKPGHMLELSGQGFGIGKGDHSASESRFAIWRIIDARDGDTVRISVETELGLTEGSAKSPFGGVERDHFYSRDEFPEEKASDWSGSLRSGELKFKVVAASVEPPAAPTAAADDETPAPPAAPATEMKPKHEAAQALFKKWQANARTDGRIPGGALESLARTAAYFIKHNPTNERVPKFTELLKRIDASRDWTQAEAVVLLDEVTAIYDKLPGWVGMHVRPSIRSPIQSGKPLPEELSNAAWGQPAENGLRAAWLLEPVSDTYPLGTALKARILFHNTGKKTVIFQTEVWHQPDHKARNATGAVIKVSSVYWEVMPDWKTVRLAPGEYAETGAHGIEIGAENEGEDEDNWDNVRVGAWIEAKEGDEVTFVPGAVAASDQMLPRKTPGELWKAIVEERIGREAPLPAAAADREQLIRRVTFDLFGVLPTQEEIAAFTADKSPDALAGLGKRLLPRVAPFAGNLPAGEIKFRVTAADPDAAKRPRVATGPGYYTLGDNKRLRVDRTPNGNRSTNKATIQFFSPDRKAEPPGQPYRITLPDGTGSYAIAWEPGSTVLWVRQTGLVRKYDFANPAQVKETRFEDGEVVNGPEQISNALKAALVVPLLLEVSLRPKKGAKLEPGTEERLQWGEPVKGLRAAIVIRTSPDEPTAGDRPDLYLVVQNVSNAPIRLSDTATAPNHRTLYIKLDGEIQLGIGAKEPSLGVFVLQPREVAFVLMFSPDAQTSEGHTTGSILAEGALKDTHQTLVAHVQIEQAPAGAWTGKLVTGETSGAVAAGKPQPKDESAQSLFRKWQDSARINGKIPGGALGSLATAVSNFVKHNPTDERAPKLAELLKRMDMSRDWTQADAVALLDDVTAIYASLPEWAEDLTRFTIAEIIRTGQPLPAELEDAPWGEAQPNGLRAAWLLDPRAQQHRLNSPLKSRILFHNAGKNTVMFRALTWNQSGSHKTRDAKGAEIRISAVSWTTIPQIFACRLAPGEFTEVTGAGIGVGANRDDEDWRGTRVGAWIEAKEGDEVTFTPAPVSADGNDGRAGVLGEPWWLAFVTNRLNRDAPLPADAAERKRLLDRAVRDLFGTAPTPEEAATFVADRAPDAMGALAKRLAQRAGTTPFTGTLQSGETKFRVLPVDPDAAKKPRVATGPGRYTLGDNVRLVIVRRPDGDRRVNEANIVFFSSAPKVEPPGKPHEIKLPDGYHTWAIAWERGSTVLWVAEKSVLRSYDFTNPADVKETRIETADITHVAEPFREALRPALEGGSSASERPAATPAAEALP